MRGMRVQRKTGISVKALSEQALDQSFADRLAIIVVGMHRSGTSAIAGALNIIGFSTPDDLLLPGPENPKGFFESQRIVQFNEALLKRLGSAWDDPAPLPEAWELSPIGQQACEDLRSLIGQEIERKPLLVLKDPRICRLLPVWKSALASAGIAARYVLTFRGPHEVSASLQARNNFSRSHSLLLWLEYTLAAERYLRDEPTSILAYETFLDDWRSGFDAIASNLGVTWPVPPRRFERELDAFLSQELRRNRLPPLNAKSSDVVERLCASTFEALSRLAAASDDTGRHSLDLCRSEQLKIFDAVGTVISDDQKRANALLDQLERERNVAIALQNELHAAVKKKQADIEERDSVIEELHGAISERDKSIIALNDSVHERNISVNQLQSELTDRVSYLNQEIAHRDLAIQERDTVIESVERQLLELERARTDLDEALRIERERCDVLIAHRVQAEQRLNAIEHSTIWRAGGVVRRAAGIMPPGVIRNVRRLAKATWWIITPHKLRERLNFLRLRQSGGLVPPSRGLLDMTNINTDINKNDLDVVRSETIDIVVCVHNGLNFVRECLDSLIRNTLPPYHLIIIDDGSDIETRDYLRRFAAANHATLKRNENASGYTLAANRGLRSSTAPWVVLLNSDTVVTEGWLDRMWRHGHIDDAVGAIGPLSNTASWQSVPEILVNGDWADNAYTHGLDAEKLAIISREFSMGPLDMPFLNGFCYMIGRRALDRIGPFDERTFGAGYGEENDFSIRLRKGGFKLIVATDAYVYHAQSKSYSTDRRIALAGRADEALARKHDPHVHIYPQAAYCREGLAFHALRARISAGIERHRLLDEGRSKFEGRRVAFILPVTEPGGGANVILSEAQAMRDMGVDVTILNFERFQSAFDVHGRPDGIRFKVFRDEVDLREFLEEPEIRFDGVIASLYKSVYWLPAERSEANTAYGYYIQDFEPLFFPDDEAERSLALSSYGEPHLKLFTKTLWNQKSVADACARIPTLVGCSVQYRMFSPSNAKSIRGSKAPVHIAAMVRPSTPRRAAERTVAILDVIKEKYHDQVRVSVFGASAHDMLNSGLNRVDFDHKGILAQDALASLLADVDVFVDFSNYQAMGLTLLEGMASGCAVIGPSQGGATAFLNHERNGLVVNSENFEECVGAVSRLVDDTVLRGQLQRQALSDVSAYLPERAALAILSTLFRER